MDHLTLGKPLAMPPLAVERELELARAARRGDRHARDALIRHSLRLVALRVGHLRVPPSDVDDALQAGSLGLIAAIDRYDPDRGAKLATYAWPWITAAIRSAAHPASVALEAVPPTSTGRGDLEALVGRLPARLAEVLRLRFRLGERPDAPRTQAEVAAMLRLSIGQVRRAEAQALGTLRHRLARLGDRNPL